MLTKLEVLSLAGNKLTELPVALCALTSLRVRKLLRWCACVVLCCVVLPSVCEYAVCVSVRVRLVSVCVCVAGTRRVNYLLRAGAKCGRESTANSTPTHRQAHTLTRTRTRTHTHTFTPLMSLDPAGSDRTGQRAAAAILHQAVRKKVGSADHECVLRRGGGRRQDHHHRVPIPGTPFVCILCAVCCVCVCVIAGHRVFFAFREVGCIRDCALLVLHSLAHRGAVVLSSHSLILRCRIKAR